ncbi:hypothetical protein RJ639_011612 [Escallonia herrerae]|uniref:Two-component response regulator n=1 Tax=Escallonia herrerae TaxID=1293975 RepID=A0AA88VL12_9ASTE|nr:hypothetical protein RJ639_011612 [Escallonia herrerae]
MTVEEIRGRIGGEDKFPVGMRVLAVDDDPTCLMLLDGLLRKCQYQVTTTSQARTALRMLRENKNRFDLVISDVHMPDMDGFKLLELVGLELDLPVIMLSANSDSKYVMKGITHGACDYLVKPVRLEELRNIWQHVIRRKKIDPKCQNKSKSQVRDRQESEGEQGPALTGSADQNGKPNRKRKDEEEEGEEEGNESEDPATQKKPRVVWSIELHRKFVAAVNQLGIEKAVPKRILDLMNVEGLTRENVASHLQAWIFPFFKYRLYLKRISQQANMVAALGGKDASFMRMGSFDGLGDFRTLAGPGRLPNNALSSYSSPGVLGRLNSPAGMSIRSLTSSALIQPSHALNPSNSFNSLEKFHPVVSLGNQNTVLQGFASSLEFDQLQQSKCTTGVGDFRPIDDSRLFTAASTFTDTRVAVGSSSHSLTGAPTNPLMLQGNSPQTKSGEGFENRSSLRVGSLYSDSFNTVSSVSPNFLDHGRSSENWQNGIHLSKFSSNPLPLIEHSNHDQLLPNSMRYNSPTTSPIIQNHTIGFSSTSTASAALEDLRGECQEGLVYDHLQNLSQAPKQMFEQQKQDNIHNSSNAFSTLNSLASANSRLAPPLSQIIDQSNGVCNRRIDVSLFDRSNGRASTLVQHGEIEKPTMDIKMMSNNDYQMEQRKSQNGCVPYSHDSLDELMNAMMKRV